MRFNTYSFIASPGVVIGHNDDIAWGVTNVGADVQGILYQIYFARELQCTI
jgi:acyl-homoserine lactone acylase PvdQ